MWKFIKYGLFLGLSVTCLAGTSLADTIIKFELDEIGPDVTFDGTTLSTADDGDATTIGEQNTDINFVGPLEGVFADIFAGASLTLDAVVTSGAASVTGSLVVQETSGGTFSVWDNSNNLLLSGALDAAVLTGSVTASTGSYFNTQLVTFTGGSLLPLLISDSGGLSIALAGILSDDGSGHMVVNNGVLSPFTANGTGLIDGEVPEPATALLLLSGAMGMVLRRRRVES